MKTTKAVKDAWIKQGSEIETDLLGIFGKNDPIVIADIGACDGLSSVIYANIFPNAGFHVFEPVYENFVEMNGNLFEYLKGRKIKTHFCALGDKKGEAEFYLSFGEDKTAKPGWESGNKSSSLYPPKIHLIDFGWCKFIKSKVAVRTLDSFKIPQLDFAHIDVQGAELKVLRGGKETFKTTKAIWLEVMNVELYDGQPLKNEVRKYLEDEGFTVVKDTSGTKNFGELLCVRK